MAGFLLFAFRSLSYSSAISYVHDKNYVRGRVISVAVKDEKVQLIMRRQSGIMCGRFYIDGPAEQEIKRIARRTSLPGSMLSAGTRRDVHPTEKAAILSYEGEEIAAVSMRWGFPPRGAGQLLINGICRIYCISRE